LRNVKFVVDIFCFKSYRATGKGSKSTAASADEVAEINKQEEIVINEKIPSSALGGESFLEAATLLIIRCQPGKPLSDHIII
jgi:hypothetical protein